MCLNWVSKADLGYIIIWFLLCFCISSYVGEGEVRNEKRRMKEEMINLVLIKLYRFMLRLGHLLFYPQLNKFWIKYIHFYVMKVLDFELLYTHYRKSIKLYKIFVFI